MVVLLFEFCADALSIASPPKPIVAMSARTKKNLFIFLLLKDEVIRMGNEGNLFSTGMEVNVFEGRGVGRFEISEMPVIPAFTAREWHANR
jgi:hypothetical protein